MRHLLRLGELRLAAGELLLRAGALGDVGERGQQPVAVADRAQLEHALSELHRVGLVGRAGGQHLDARVAQRGELRADPRALQRGPGLAHGARVRVPDLQITLDRREQHRRDGQRLEQLAA